MDHFNRASRSTHCSLLQFLTTVADLLLPRSVTSQEFVLCYNAGWDLRKVIWSLLADLQCDAEELKKEE